MSKSKPVTADRTFIKGFDPQGFTVLVELNEKEVIATYTNEFKGREYFHIRVIWQDDGGAWGPGKGLSIAKDKAPTLSAALWKHIQAMQKAAA